MVLQTVFDPVNQILDHILQVIHLSLSVIFCSKHEGKNSDAELACASDQDLCYVCQVSFQI